MAALLGGPFRLGNTTGVDWHLPRSRDTGEQTGALRGQASLSQRLVRAAEGVGGPPVSFDKDTRKWLWVSIVAAERREVHAVCVVAVVVVVVACSRKCRVRWLYNLSGHELLASGDGCSPMQY